MDTSIEPHHIYYTYMVDAKIRLLTAEKILASRTPVSGYGSLDAEFCLLQIRRIVESITFGAMIRERGRYSALHSIQQAENPRGRGSPATDWKASEILKRLVEISPYVLPIPVRDQPAQTAPGIFHFDRKDIEVNHARLIEFYKRAGGFLHAQNPLASDFVNRLNEQRKAYEGMSKELERILDFLRKLLWKHIAVTLEFEERTDPRTAASPKFAWIVDFMTNNDHQVSIQLAEST